MGGAPSRHDQQPRSRHGRDPRMKDLVIELKDVNWHKLGILLEVPLDKLDKIDEDHQSSERKLSEVLRYWLLNDRSPSWDKICEALQRIGGFGRLVRELRMKYCSLKTCREHHTHGTENAGPGSAAVHTCEGVESTIPHQTQKAIERLQRDFRERVSRIRLSLTATISLTAIKDLLKKELPAGEVKNQVGHLLSKNYSLIMSSDDIDQLFVHLSNIHAWDFLHPQLLEYLVQELAGDETKKIMTEYKSLLIQFRSTTKMSELSGWFGDISETSDSTFKKIVLSLGDNWKDKTYEEFEVRRVFLLRQRVFSQSSLHLCGVLTGSILVALAIPNSIYEETMEQIRSSENSFLTFLVDNDISAVFGEGFCLIRDVRSALLSPGHPGQRRRPGNRVAGLLGHLSRRGRPDNPPVINPPTLELSTPRLPTPELNEVEVEVERDSPDLEPIPSLYNYDTTDSF